MAKKKIEVRPRKSKDWEEMCAMLLNSNIDVWFYPKANEIRINPEVDDVYVNLVLKADGTWYLE